MTDTALNDVGHLVGEMALEHDKRRPCNRKESGSVRLGGSDVLVLIGTPSIYQHLLPPITSLRRATGRRTSGSGNTGTSCKSFLRPPTRKCTSPWLS